MIISQKDERLKFLLHTGALYFLGVAVVHSLGVKVPGLFVYFNVPSYAYQDRIISFLAFGWSGLFYLTSRKLDSDLIKYILVIGLIAILALLVNTLITNFEALAPNIQPWRFLIIILGLFLYWLSLVVFSRHLLATKKQ